MCEINYDYDDDDDDDDDDGTDGVALAKIFST